MDRAAACSGCAELPPRFRVNASWALDLFDGAAVMNVLRTHPQVYVNGILIGNPHYQADKLPG